MCHKKAPLCLAMHMAGLRQLAARNEVVPVNDIMSYNLKAQGKDQSSAVVRSFFFGDNVF